MNSLIMHETTREQLERFLANPAQAVLLVGPDGIGKSALAEQVLGQVLHTTSLDAYPHFLRISPEGASISIEHIRHLQKFLQLKTVGAQAFRRAILIEHAQALTTEAQNAYLKLLEEPPADTLMVLTANSPRALLPTILSRLQTITVFAPDEAQLQPLLHDSGKDTAVQRQAYFLSGGLPGLLAALLAEDETHPLLASVVAAKDILQKSPFERLSLTDSLSKQKESATAVLEALRRIAEAGIIGASAKQDAGKLKQWHHIRKETLAAKEMLAKNANVKLTLSNLFLHLPG